MGKEQQEQGQPVLISQSVDLQSDQNKEIVFGVYKNLS